MKIFSKKAQNKVLNYFCKKVSDSYELLSSENIDGSSLFLRHKKELFYVIITQSILSKKTITLIKNKYSNTCIFVFPAFLDNYFYHRKLLSFKIPFYFYKKNKEHLIFYDRLFFPYFLPMAKRKIDIFCPKFVKRRVIITHLSPIFLQRLKNDLYFKGDYLDLSFEKSFFKNLFTVKQKSFFKVFYNLFWEFFLKKFCK